MPTVDSPTTPRRHSRRDSAQFVIRMTDEERATIRSAFPHGELNGAAKQLLLDAARARLAAGEAAS